MFRKYLALTFLTVFPADLLWATNYLSPVPEPSRQPFTGYFANSSIEMEENVDIDRKILGLGYTTNFGVNSLKLAFGYTFDAETDGDFEGNGFNLAANFLFPITGVKVGQIYGYGGFEYVDEDYEHDAGAEVDFNYTGLKGGASFLFTKMKSVKPYGALEFYLLNDGEFEAGSVSDETERDSSVVGRVGLLIEAGGVFIRPELVLLGEQTILVAIGSR